MTTPAPAAPAVSALLAELFDDAGLFPPASLPMDEAFAAHRLAQQGAYRWMLGRFVCPASRLVELADVANRYGDALRLAIVIDDATALDDAPPLVDEHGWRVEAVEARVPDGDVGGGARSLRHHADRLGAGAAFLEIPWAEFPLENLARAARDMSAGRVDLKLRCGGDVAGAIPSPATVAAFVLAARDAGVRLKATAGLHHPFRHPDRDADAVQHGFINLLTAATFAHCRTADEADLAAILADEDHTAFVIDDHALAWRGRTINARQIADSRRSLVAAIGSCSFREPVDDLVALGLLGVS